MQTMAKKRKSETPAVASSAVVASIAKSFAFLDAHGAGFNSHPHHAHQPHHKAC